ncbi:MAG: hypothetical protein MJE77_40525 [Proteobacteria bacterium]|nr:hypothetical protein [Pseudomonadota bacterium]
MKKRVIGIVGAVLISVCASAAHAQDAKTYAGSECVVLGTLSPAYLYSGIGNPSAAAAMRVECPAIHDDLPMAIQNGWVRVKDLHGTLNVVCRLYSVYGNAGGGYSGWASPPQASAGAANVWQTLFFGFLASNVQTHYFYSCTIPPETALGRSYILNYNVTETP